MMDTSEIPVAGHLALQLRRAIGASIARYQNSRLGAVGIECLRHQFWDIQPVPTQACSPCPLMIFFRLIRLLNWYSFVLSDTVSRIFRSAGSGRRSASTPADRSFWSGIPCSLGDHAVWGTRGGFLELPLPRLGLAAVIARPITAVLNEHTHLSSRSRCGPGTDCSCHGTVCMP